MLTNNAAWLRLQQLKPIELGLKDLTPENRQKAIDTAKHALSYNGETDTKAVLERCVIATLAEQLVAVHMNGHCINDENVDITDPYTYAFDVLTGPEYYGFRIEVKTQQSQAKWVQAHTRNSEPYPGDIGINLKPFLETGIADLIIIFRTVQVEPGRWLFTPFVMSDRDAMHPDTGFIKKSAFSGWYVNPRVDTNNLNLFVF